MFLSDPTHFIVVFSYTPLASHQDQVHKSLGHMGGLLNVFVSSGTGPSLSQLLLQNKLVPAEQLLIKPSVGQQNNQSCKVCVYVRSLESEACVLDFLDIVSVN